MSCADRRLWYIKSSSVVRYVVLGLIFNFYAYDSKLACVTECSNVYYNCLRFFISASTASLISYKTKFTGCIFLLCVCVCVYIWT